MSTRRQTTPRPRGRPRAFDREVALARARETFWALGYEGASINDLTDAMRITPQSLYAAFKSKADLYREALVQYGESVGAFTRAALDGEADAARALQRVLRESAHEFCRPDRPAGCMIATAMQSCASEHRHIAAHTAGLRQATMDALRTRIRQGLDAGQLRADTDVEALVRFVGAMIQGMSIQARDGATEAELAALAELACTSIERYRAD